VVIVLIVSQLYDSFRISTDPVFYEYHLVSMYTSATETQKFSCFYLQQRDASWSTIRMNSWLQLWPQRSLVLRTCCYEAGALCLFLCDRESQLVPTTGHLIQCRSYVGRSSPGTKR
jgi:hypothetical protein